MANKLDIPAELAHLIEKREQDRRAAEEAGPDANAASGEASEAAAEISTPTVDRRVRPDRRQSS